MTVVGHDVVRGGAQEWSEGAGAGHSLHGGHWLIITLWNQTITDATHYNSTLYNI